MKYYIQTRTAHGWHRLYDDNYETLLDASHSIERHIDRLFINHGEVLPTSIFRIVKCKLKKVSE
jgi:hypothetical protein